MKKKQKQAEIKSELYNKLLSVLPDNAQTPTIELHRTIRNPNRQKIDFYLETQKLLNQGFSKAKSSYKNSKRNEPDFNLFQNYDLVTDQDHGSINPYYVPLTTDPPLEPTFPVVTTDFEFSRYIPKPRYHQVNLDSLSKVDGVKNQIINPFFPPLPTNDQPTQKLNIQVPVVTTNSLSKPSDFSISNPPNNFFLEEVNTEDGKSFNIWPDFPSNLQDQTILQTPNDNDLNNLQLVESLENSLKVPSEELKNFMLYLRPNSKNIPNIDSQMTPSRKSRKSYLSLRTKVSTKNSIPRTFRTTTPFNFWQDFQGNSKNQITPIFKRKYDRDSKIIQPVTSIMKPPKLSSDYLKAFMLFHNKNHGNLPETDTLGSNLENYLAQLLRSNITGPSITKKSVEDFSLELSQTEPTQFPFLTTEENSIFLTEPTMLPVNIESLQESTIVQNFLSEDFSTDIIVSNTITPSSTLPSSFENQEFSSPLSLISSSSDYPSTASSIRQVQLKSFGEHQIMTKTQPPKTSSSSDHSDELEAFLRYLLNQNKSSQFLEKNFQVTDQPSSAASPETHLSTPTSTLSTILDVVSTNNLDKSDKKCTNHFPWLNLSISTEGLPLEYSNSLPLGDTTNFAFSSVSTTETIDNNSLPNVFDIISNISSITTETTTLASSTVCKTKLNNTSILTTISSSTFYYDEDEGEEVESSNISTSTSHHPHTTSSWINKTKLKNFSEDITPPPTYKPIFVELPVYAANSSNSSSDLFANKDLIPNNFTSITEKTTVHQEIDYMTDEEENGTTYEPKNNLTVENFSSITEFPETDATPVVKGTSSSSPPPESTTKGFFSKLKSKILPHDKENNESLSETSETVLSSIATTTVTPTISEKSSVITEAITPQMNSDVCSWGNSSKLNSCLCSMDVVIFDLRDILQKVNVQNSTSLMQMLDTYLCHKFTNLEKGIVLDNQAIPSVAQRSRFLRSISKRKVEKDLQIQTILTHVYNLENSGSNTYALPGTSVEIPCSSKEMESFNSQEYTFSWENKDGQPVNVGKVQENDGTLLVENVTPQIDGNYSCLVKDTEQQNGPLPLKVFKHQIFVIDWPKYNIFIPVMYNVSRQCDTSDLEIINLYLAQKLTPLLCGSQIRACNILVDKAQCVFRKDMTIHISLSIIAEMNSPKTILTNMNVPMCNLNCQIKIYMKLMTILSENLPKILYTPIHFDFPYRQQQLVPEITPIMASNGLMKLTTLCPAGFEMNREYLLCVPCQKGHYSDGVSFACKKCPTNTFQKLRGASSCTKCTSAFEDKNCVLMYTNFIQYKTYTWIFIVCITIVGVVVLYFMCCRSKPIYRIPDERKTKRKRRFRRFRNQEDNDDDNLESGLLTNVPRKNRNKFAPPPPPPDFE